MGKELDITLDMPNKDKLLKAAKMAEKQAKEAEAAREAEETAAPKKKKNILRVYHAQNASDGGRRKKTEGVRKQRPVGARVAPEKQGAEQVQASARSEAEELKTAVSAAKAEAMKEVKAAEAPVGTPAPKAVKAADSEKAEAAKSEKPVEIEKTEAAKAEKPAQAPKAEKSEDAAKEKPAREEKPAETPKAGKSVEEGKTEPVKAGKTAEETKTEPVKADKTADTAKAEPVKAEKTADTVKAEPVKAEKHVEAKKTEPEKPAQAAGAEKSEETARKETAKAEKPASEVKAEAAKAEESTAAAGGSAKADTGSTTAGSDKGNAGTAASSKPEQAGAGTGAPRTPRPQGARTSSPSAGGGRREGMQTARTGQGSVGSQPRQTSSAQHYQNETRSGQEGRRMSDGRPSQGQRPVRTQDGRPPRPADQGTGRGFVPRSADGQRPARPGQDNRQGRPGAGMGQTGGGFRTDSRSGDSRPGQARGGQTRRVGEAFSQELGKASKDRGRERDKNRKKDLEKTNNQANAKSGRQGQGSLKNQARTSKPLTKPHTAPKPEEKKPEIKEITIPETLTIRELADAMKKQPSEIVKKLFLRGELVTVNSEIDYEKASEIALEFDIIAEKEVQVDVIEELLKDDETENESDLVPRPPVVCVMGHVDHGKTSLLDYIRNTHVTKGEAGGITQHIGAYVVKVGDQKITFLDTPGHEAFTAMRMRGANATDIAVLVVAADDGVMPQTIEAISHAKAAGVEIIVAINKIDKPSANVDRVKQELSEHELVPEDWGGHVPVVPVSAHTGEGIDDLLEMILLTAEISELKANPKRAARGLVIEAKLDKGKGPVATILVQKGTLHQGDFIAAGSCSGKVRAMMDNTGERLKDAGPSMPVEILGLNDVPNAGEVLMAFPSDKEAKVFADTFVAENKKHLLEETKGKLSLDNLFDQIQASDLKELPLIVKADVQGSVEAVRNSLVKLSNDEVVVKVIHGGVGAINESDVSLAVTSNAIIIGFNVRPDNTAKQLAEQEGVDLRLYKVIYQAITDVEAAMKGMLDPIFEEKVIGHAQVRQLFKASGIGTIAGSYILDGIFQRNCKVRITHEGEQIYEGELASLKRFKDDVKEVKAGYECGLVFRDFNDVHEDDLIEAYIMVEVPR